MGKKNLIAFWIASAVLLTAGCRRISPAAGNLVLQVSSASLETKTNPSAAEGELFSNLLVVITDTDLKPLTGVNPIQFWEGASGETTKSLEFRNIPVGTYEVFAFANISSSSEEDVWGGGLNLTEIKASNINCLLDGDGKLDVNKTFAELSAGSVPATPTSSAGMLLTGRQTVTIDTDNNSGSVTLLRPVARLRVLLRNFTGCSITLDALSFTEFNAPTSYLVDHRDGSGVPGVPVLTYGSLPAFGTAQTMSADKRELDVYSTLLYESAVPGTERYKMYAKVTITKADSSEDIGYLGGGSAPGNGSVLKRIVNQVASPLTYIRRNEDLTVIINVYYGAATGQFDFDVIAWVDGGTESIGGAHSYI